MTQDKIRYSEKFLSLQAEGLYVGTPSVFFRTFGCNFRCMSFGLGKDEPSREQKRQAGIIHNAEVKALLDSGVVENTNTFEELPLVHTGCDTYASIYPEFKKFAKFEECSEIAAGLTDLTPNKEWINNTGQDIHLILTGGEPLLWQKQLPTLLGDRNLSGLKNITFETNGTQKLSSEFVHFLESSGLFTTWSCSPKLSVSGEDIEKSILPDVLLEYQNVKNSQMYLKFVVSSQEELDDVDAAVLKYRNAGITCPVYLMPCGGTTEGYDKVEKQIADLALRSGYRFSPRLQLQLYGNSWGT